MTIESIPWWYRKRLAMRVTRQFRVTLDVEPIEFDSDRLSNAEIIVKEKYQGRNLQGFYIQEVLKIERLSRTRITNTGDAVAYGTVDVQFLANCHRYYQSDPIPGMKITGGGGGEILTGTPVKTVDLPPIALTILDPKDTFAVGKIIPVELQHVSHAPMQKEASGIAKFLTCREEEVIWKVSSALTSRLDGLQQIVERVRAAVGARKEVQEGGGIQATAREFFQNRMNTFKSPRELDAAYKPRVFGNDGDGPDKIAADLKEWISSMVPGTLWSRPLEMGYDWLGVCQIVPPEKAEDLVRRSGDGAKNPPLNIVEATPEIIFSTIMHQALRSLELLNQMHKVYHDEALLRAHKNVILLMTRHQIA